MYPLLKKEMLEINAQLIRLFSDGRAIPDVDGRSFEPWEKTCATIRDQVAAEMLRVAVVGAIKSGKSSFANALFRGDHLKRGAGVVTAVVTKVRKGNRKKATIWFKSWDEVNDEMRQALLFFPDFSDTAKSGLFDIRHTPDRTRLHQALTDMGAGSMVERGRLNANTVLLANYLRGYERIQDIVTADSDRLVFENDRFKEHTAFVGDDAMAVYVRDVRLEIDTSNAVGDNVEVADCQGSDSPNPLHLAMIQDYLTLTHLIVYVISSRIGLRDADIRFLSMIRKMGIIDNILFVVNTDFSEHESLEGLKALVERVTEELAALRPSPQVYAFSALFNLFSAQSEDISEKDRQRLLQWQKDSRLVDFSCKETDRFETALSDILARAQTVLLVQNHLERMAVIAAGMTHWIGLNRDVLSGDLRGAESIMARVRDHQHQIGQVAALIKSSLAGSAMEEKRQSKAAVDRFFSGVPGDVIGDTLAFIRNYHVPAQSFSTHLESAGFAHALYLVFQEFKQALDAHLTENVNPAIIRFVKQQEARILSDLKSAVQPYAVMAGNVLTGYSGVVKTPEQSDPAPGDSNPVGPLDMDAVKKVIGLSLPPLAAALRYSARIKADATMRLGFYTLVGFMKKILKKGPKDSRQEKIMALNDGVKRIKYETEKAVAFHFKNYRENLKFQYMLKLVDAVSNSLYDAMVARFQGYTTDLKQLRRLLDKQGEEKESALDMLAAMDQQAAEVTVQIDRVREQIGSLRQR